MLEERYALALAAFPDTAAADATAVADFFLLYRAKTYLALDRDQEAVRDFRLLQKNHPQSSQLSAAILGECEAWLKLRDPRAALAAMNNPALEENAETLYFRGRAQEDAGIGRNRSTFTFESMLILSAQRPRRWPRSGFWRPGRRRFLPTIHFKPLLNRSENLIRSGRNGEARTQLLKLAAVPAPDRSSAQRLSLLRGQAEQNLGNSRAALLQLQRRGERQRLLARPVLCTFRRWPIAGCSKRLRFSRPEIWRFSAIPTLRSRRRFSTRWQPISMSRISRFRPIWLTGRSRKDSPPESMPNEPAGK